MKFFDNTSDTVKNIITGPVKLGAMGLALGGAAGASLGAVSAALGHLMVHKTEGNDLNVSIQMGAVGLGVMNASLGLLTGTCIGLAKKGYITKRGSDFDDLMAVVLLIVLLGLQPVGGVIGHEILKNSTNSTITAGDSAFYTVCGGAATVISGMLIFGVLAYLYNSVSCCEPSEVDVSTDTVTPKV